MKSILTKKHIILTILLCSVIGVAYWMLRQSIFSLNSKEFNDWINHLGWKGPFTMIALMIIEIVIPLLPGGWLGLASGYMFGPWFGFIYSYVASIGGSIILFYLSRKFGQPFINAVVSHDWPERLNHKVHQARPAFGLLYAIPLFPVEIVTLLLGLTHITRKKFLVIMMLGYIPNMLALNFLGTLISGPDNNYQTIFLILVGLAVLYLLAAWLRQKTLVKSA